VLNVVLRLKCSAERGVHTNHRTDLEGLVGCGGNAHRWPRLELDLAHRFDFGHGWQQYDLHGHGHAPGGTPGASGADGLGRVPGRSSAVRLVCESVALGRESHLFGQLCLDGYHEVSAQYSGDANFLGSSSPAAQVGATPIPTTVLGTITSTMQWQFYYTPRYMIVRALVVTGVSRGATVVVRCHGHGCPFASHTTVLPTGKKCARKAGSMCFTGGSFNVTPAFAGRQLKVGARITVNIVRRN